jgi:hypothetical protein
MLELYLYFKYPREPRPLFVGLHGKRLTRFGATHIMRRAVATPHPLSQLDDFRHSRIYPFNHRGRENAISNFDGSHTARKILPWIPSCRAER